MISAMYGVPPEPLLLDSIHGRGGLKPAELLSIYRNDTQAVLNKTLRISYPVVEQLVGVDFFAMAAAAYVRGTPSRSGDLEQYGAPFGDFLARFDAAKGLPYLADVARFESLLARVQRAPDQAALDHDRLAAMSTPEAAAGLRLALRSRVALFRSEYPVFNIWIANRDIPGFAWPIEMGDGPDRLMIVAGEEMAVSALTEAEFRFYDVCGGGNTLALTLDAALDCDLAFNLAATLAQAIKRKALTIAE